MKSSQNEATKLSAPSLLLNLKIHIFGQREARSRQNTKQMKRERKMFPNILTVHPHDLRYVNVSHQPLLMSATPDFLFSL